MAEARGQQRCSMLARLALVEIHFERRGAAFGKAEE
jgi:hypothetical protein